MNIDNPKLIKNWRVLSTIGKTGYFVLPIFESGNVRMQKILCKRCCLQLSRS